MILSSALLFPFALLIRVFTSPFDKRLVVLHRFSCFWASLYTWCNPLWKVKIEGREKLGRTDAYVIVSNHQSLLDILVLFRLHAHFKWVSKIEIFRVPFIGWNMTLNRYIKVDRGRMKSHLRMMRDCEAALRNGSSVMMFPEGTRSPDGKLLPFKEGAFELALMTKRPVLPIVISGTFRALPKRGFLLRGAHQVSVRVLDPLAYESFSAMSSTALRDRVYNLMREALMQAG